jgi:hypothetical protein
VSRITEQLVVCDECNGEIPEGADCIVNVNGTVVLGGAQHGFAGMDFCSTAHMHSWIDAHPQVATPNPPYPPPP